MTGPSAPRVVDCPSGNTYKVSVTDLPFCVIWHDRHSAYWLAALTSPYPASPDFPRKRGQNKTPRNILFISISTVSTGCCAPSKRGKGGGASHQRGNAFPRAERGRSVFLRAKARLSGLIIQRAPSINFEAPHHHPLNPLNPMNLLNLHTEGVSNEPSHRRCVHTHTFAFISYFE